MKNDGINRIEEHALRRVLAEHCFDAAGTAVRLAWLAGLLRGEIAALEWERVSFLNEQITLPGRVVPLCGELSAYLLALSERQPWRARRVVLSDRRLRPVQPQMVSTAVRAALDAGGLTGVCLLELRDDFIRRQLEAHDWQYASRVSGVEAAALRARFSALAPEGGISMRIEKRPAGGVDEPALRLLLQNEGASAAGRTLRLVWQGGLPVEEIAALTWGRVDTEHRLLRLERGDAPMGEELCAFLAPLREEGDAPVIRSPRAGRPMRPDRLSRVARAALVGAGLDNLSLRDLQRASAARGSGEEALARYVRARKTVTRAEAAAFLGVTESAAYRRLAALTERGTLTRVGARYYAADTVVPPERHRAAIVAYLERENVACRQDIAALLRVEPRQCSLILKRLVDTGVLVREKQRYRLV